ncbi:MAG: phosphatidylglycerophosphatase A [Psychrilyobacter sp.]|nr:phosphatidylglycerophosphatase A [Psychrilyobacter sp.]
MRKEIVRGLATWFGLGDSPKAPGTMGTLGAIPLFLMLNSFRMVIIDTRLYNSFYMIFLLGFFALSIYVSDRCEKEIFNEKDPQKVVIDEVLGFMVTMFLVNPVGIKETVVAVILGFLLFRFFDITKIGPIDKSQHYGNGLGVVLDDFLAGIAANFVLIVLMTIIF